MQEFVLHTGVRFEIHVFIQNARKTLQLPSAVKLHGGSGFYSQLFSSGRHRILFTLPLPV